MVLLNTTKREKKTLVITINEILNESSITEWMSRIFVQPGTKDYYYYGISLINIIVMGTLTLYIYKATNKAAEATEEASKATEKATELAETVNSRYIEENQAISFQLKLRFLEYVIQVEELLYSLSNSTSLTGLENSLKEKIQYGDFPISYNEKKFPAHKNISFIDLGRYLTDNQKEITLFWQEFQAFIDENFKIDLQKIANQNKPYKFLYTPRVKNNTTDYSEINEKTKTIETQAQSLSKKASQLREIINKSLSENV